MVSASDDCSFRHGDVFGMRLSRPVNGDKYLVFSLFDVGGPVGLVKESDF